MISSQVHRLCVYASGSLMTVILFCCAATSVSCLHFEQYSGKFSRTVSSRILLWVLLPQTGHSIQFSDFTICPPRTFEIFLRESTIITYQLSLFFLKKRIYQTQPKFLLQRNQHTKHRTGFLRFTVHASAGTKTRQPLPPRSAISCSSERVK